MRFWVYKAVADYLQPSLGSVGTAIDWGLAANAHFEVSRGEYCSIMASAADDLCDGTKRRLLGL